MVLILMGPAGCGKTTVGRLLARRLGWPFLDGDDFHPAANVAKMHSGIPLDDSDRHPWLLALQKEIERRNKAGQSAILACSALKQTYRELLGVDQQTVKTVYLRGSFELLQERLGDRRDHFMPPELLRSAHRRVFSLTLFILVMSSLSLPFFPEITEDQQARVAEAFRKLPS